MYKLKNAARYVLLEQDYTIFYTSLPPLKMHSTSRKHETTWSKSEPNVAPHPYLLLKYQANALAVVPSPNGVGTSASPGRATGCRK